MVGWFLGGIKGGILWNFGLLTTQLLRFSSDFDKTFRISFLPILETNPIEIRHGWLILGCSGRCKRWNFMEFWLVNKIAPPLFIRFWWNFQNIFITHLRQTLLKIVTIGWCWGVLGGVKGGFYGTLVCKQNSTSAFHPILMKLHKYLYYLSKTNPIENRHD